MKLKIMLVAMMACTAASAWAAPDDLVLLVHHASGKMVACQLADRPKLDVTTEKVSLVSGRTSLTLDVMQNTRITFCKESELPTKLEEAKAEVGRIWFDGEMLRAEGLKAGALVLVYDANGRQVLKGVADSDGRAQLPMTALAKGVYVVKSDLTTLKVSKR